MGDDKVREHLRKALDEIAAAEKQRVTEVLDQADAQVFAGIELMAPLIVAIKALRSEVGDTEGLEISTAEQGHMAHLSAETSVSYQTITISSNYKNNAYKVEELWSSAVSGALTESEKEYATVEEVMAHVLDLVGKHIGAMQAHAERKNA